MRDLGSTLLLAALMILPSACGGEPADDFTRLIRPGPGRGERYDLTLENVTNIRGAELAPGAAPAVPVIDGRTARKQGHFITTYSGEVTPAGIATRITDGLMAAEFLSRQELKSEGTDSETRAVLTYAFPGGTGTLTLRIRETGTPNRLDLAFEVVETLE